MDPKYKKHVFPDACLSRCVSPKNCFCKEKIKMALDKAHEIRRFEIDLYWRRSLYFWGFQVGFFAAYSLIFSALSELNGAKEKLAYIAMFVVAFLGLVISVLWHFLEKGSKAWQENWENHIDQLEDEFTGRLHKIVLGKAEDFYSVTKINQRIIFFIGFAWLCLASLPIFVKFCNKCFDPTDALSCALLVFVCMLAAVIFIYVVFMKCNASWIKIKSGFPDAVKHNETPGVDEGIGEYEKKVNIYYRWKPLQDKRDLVFWKRWRFRSWELLISMFRKK